MTLAKSLLEVGLKLTQYNTQVYQPDYRYTTYLTQGNAYYTIYSSVWFTEYITTYPNTDGNGNIAEQPPGSIGGWAGGWYVYTYQLTSAPTNRQTYQEFYTNESIDDGYWTSITVWKYTTW